MKIKEKKNPTDIVHSKLPYYHVYIGNMSYFFHFFSSHTLQKNSEERIMRAPDNRHRKVTVEASRKLIPVQETQTNLLL